MLIRTCRLAKESLKTHNDPRIHARLAEFMKMKNANPMQMFGSSDKSFASDGYFQGFRHAHLTHDVSVIYRIYGKNPAIMDVYGVFSHDEIGTGQPANKKVQKSMAQRVNNSTFD